MSIDYAFARYMGCTEFNDSADKVLKCVCLQRSKDVEMDPSNVV